MDLKSDLEAGCLAHGGVQAINSLWWVVKSVVLRATVDLAVISSPSKRALLGSVTTLAFGHR